MTCVQASLYEHLFPLSTVMKQRVVEHFDGDGLCTDRWATQNFQGTPTFAMSDNQDEGFSILTGSTTNDGGEIDFNGVNAFNDCGSVVIGVIRALDSTCCNEVMTGSRVVTGALDFAFVGMDKGFSACFFLLDTSDAACRSQTNTATCLDTSFHNHKLELKVCCACYTIDGGCACVTKGTDLPANAQQPFFFVATRHAGAEEGRIKYLEAYNT